MNKDGIEVWLNHYYTTPYYLAYDGRVYQGTIKHPFPADDYLFRSGEFSTIREAREESWRLKKVFQETGVQEWKDDDK